ncbi:pyridoxamine 5'-phosphate oxidase [Legionella dresdenensis]|uniref:Pyridoxine/pyridoxamine 5'-phosphate oxidase n=1 Tax=Legionella dresdenensis TaxID=450200 RepID=A0ABV8CFV7_9GAMM
MSKWHTIADVRREYGDLTLSEEQADADPFMQFRQWFEEILAVDKFDPTAMVLSTVDERGFPDSRVVLLKGMENESFVFYTNYESTKAIQLRHTPYAAVNFYWPEMSRQIRIRGRVKKASARQSDAYFMSRPLESQISAIASPQSRQIESRVALEQAFNELVKEYGQKAIVRPKTWGGYQILPDEIEFWQGRNNRLHDRIHYFKQGGKWTHRRLAP